MDPEKLPSDVSELVYKFDPKSIRWRLNFAMSKEKKYTSLEEMSGLQLTRSF